MAEKKISEQVVPSGLLKRLKVSDIKRSHNNPRTLFDPGPLKELKESIREHGVLVPLTVYKLSGQDKYAILDGERRYRCCVELEEEGANIGDIPANVVSPPDKVAGLLYMFSIHNFREQWELMPTALALETIIERLKETETKKLSKLTGMSTVQVERCKILIDLPEKYQKLSLEPDPGKRIPSNFWIELDPILLIYESQRPDILTRLGKDALIDKFVERYQNKIIKSIIHLRRIKEAFEYTSETNEAKINDFNVQLGDFLEDPNQDPKNAFNEYLPTLQAKSVIKTCSAFIENLAKIEGSIAIEPEAEIIKKLEEVRNFLVEYIERVKSSSKE